MKKNKSWGVLLLVLLPLAPFIAVFAAYLNYFRADGITLSEFIQAAYSSVHVYSGSLMDREPPPLADWGAWYPVLEIIRWVMMIILAGTAVKLLGKSVKRLLIWIISLTPPGRNMFALHGDDAPASRLKKELRRRAVKADIPEKFRLRNHILAFRNSGDLFRYLDANYARLTRRKDSRIFIYTDAVIHSLKNDPRIIINNIAKNCARVYWKKHWLRPEEKKIILIGSGNYLQQIITQALQVNVFSRTRELEYHVFGDGRDYSLSHPNLENFMAVDGAAPGMDSIFFHRESWKEQQQLIRSADRVILCCDSENESLAIMDFIMEHRLAAKLYIRVHNADMVSTLWSLPKDEPRIIPFGTDRELYTLDQITNATLNSRGMLIHAYYFHNSCPNRGKMPCCGDHLANCTNCACLRSDWDNLSPFKRSSSIAQDDHADVKIRELLGFHLEDVSTLADKAYSAYCALPDAEKEKLHALEHARWMRFYWLHGWSYAPRRCDARLQHNMLIPYDQLSRAEQLKDADAFHVLSELDTYREYHLHLVSRI